MAINTIIDYAPEYVEKLEQISFALVDHFYNDFTTVKDVQSWMSHPANCDFLIKRIRDLKSHLDK